MEMIRILAGHGIAKMHGIGIDTEVGGVWAINREDMKRDSRSS
jgi:hypothetical protein